jgi:hypothetical protein
MLNNTIVNILQQVPRPETESKNYLLNWQKVRLNSNKRMIFSQKFVHYQYFLDLINLHN